MQNLIIDIGNTAVKAAWAEGPTIGKTFRYQGVRIRHLGEKLGFEKIIIKNGILIAFFINNQMAAYYKSGVFTKILEKVSEYSRLFELKQNDSKLRIISRKVNTLSDAYNILCKLR